MRKEKRLIFTAEARRSRENIVSVISTEERLNRLERFQQPRLAHRAQGTMPGVNVPRFRRFFLAALVEMTVVGRDKALPFPATVGTLIVILSNHSLMQTYGALSSKNSTLNIRFCNLAKAPGTQRKNKAYVYHRGTETQRNILLVSSRPKGEISWDLRRFLLTAFVEMTTRC